MISPSTTEISYNRRRLCSTPGGGGLTSAPDRSKSTDDRAICRGRSSALRRGAGRPVRRRGRRLHHRIPSDGTQRTVRAVMARRGAVAPGYCTRSAPQRPRAGCPPFQVCASRHRPDSRRKGTVHLGHPLPLLLTSFAVIDAAVNELGSPQGGTWAAMSTSRDTGREAVYSGQTCAFSELARGHELSTAIPRRARHKAAAYSARDDTTIDEVNGGALMSLSCECRDRGSS
jgi:hypothetical protein